MIEITDRDKTVILQFREIMNPNFYKATVERDIVDQ